MQTIATSNNGSYAGLTVQAIGQIEGALAKKVPGAPYISALNGSANSYSVTVTSPTGDTFTVKGAANGATKRTCTGSKTLACKGRQW
ncbi:MAG: hypothetical protein ACYDHH_28145 [Solirubrobacteraceae bacterium]